jgi:NAD(P)-dependent dehydrogenase (short-subunit alcohol dehydrogenase family)
MPVPFLFYLVENGPPPWLRDHGWTIFYCAATIACLVFIKRYTSGKIYVSEKPLHGKVVMMTGGTSGIGAEAAFELASRGAQLVLLTQSPMSDAFLVEYIQDLRDKTNNQLIYAEQVDLSSLHSIRKFATAWIDNSPPRRLDMVILNAATMTPPGGKRVELEGGIEHTWMVNFLANFHLLGILSPAIRAQPFDRDVRIIIMTCSSYIRSPSLKEVFGSMNWSPARAYARSKLALNVFGQAFQKHLDAYKRPDGLPMNARVVFVDPGLCRSPGTRRWLTRGTLLGLFFYMIGYAFPWLLLKSPWRGAQSILCAVMDGHILRGGGGKLIKECTEVDFARKEVHDEEVAKKLWEESDALIETAEKAQAKKRANEKAQDKKSEEKLKEEERAAEVESLMSAIREGKEKEKEKQAQRKKDANDGKGKPRKRTK